MKFHWTDTIRVAGMIAAASVVFAAAPATSDGPPTWAYGTDPATIIPRNPQARRPAPDPTPLHLEGSTFEFTRAQINNLFGPADWFPGDHPEMPDVVAHGRRPKVMACALCHYPNGKGRSENASVAGFPTSYFIEQIDEFRSGARKSADSRKRNTNVMIAIAQGMTDEEIKAAANYFGSMKWTPWIKVVETDTVPKMYSAGGMLLPVKGGGNEPIGERIIETPVDVEATEMYRNPRSGFIAYAPPGSIEKGKELVTTNTGKTIPCGICHGPDLNGLGPVPGIAGRSPSYLVRQLYDMQQGTRNGTWTQLMKPVVSKLSEEDMVNIAAYTSSRIP
ncbi:MAG TPA: c-type cytochrome [Bryobacteraceae bacterium]|jgi:cytochrome c553|nr:c-type cytochrome [Bryobacteraceae bacterium]